MVAWRLDCSVMASVWQFIMAIAHLTTRCKVIFVDERLISSRSSAGPETTPLATILRGSVVALSQYIVSKKLLQPLRYLCSLLPHHWMITIPHSIDNNLTTFQQSLLQLFIPHIHRNESAVARIKVEGFDPLPYCLNRVWRKWDPSKS
jgi:hypothetical protein